MFDLHNVHHKLSFLVKSLEMRVCAHLSKIVQDVHLSSLPSKRVA